MAIIGPAAHPRLAFLNMQSRRQIMYFAPVRDIQDGVSGITYTDVKTPENLLLDVETKTLANALWMIDYKKFFTAAKPILDGAGKTTTEVLEEYAATSSGATIMRPGTQSLDRLLMDALVHRARAYNDPEFISALVVCLESSAQGKIDAKLQEALCKVICDLDLEHRVQYFARLFQSVSQGKKPLSQYIAREKKPNQDDFLPTWGSLCEQILEAFLNICACTEIDSPGLRASAFSDAFGARLGTKRTFIPEVIGLNPVWHGAIEKSAHSSAYLQALEGLAFAEAERIHKEIKSKVPGQKLEGGRTVHALFSFVLTVIMDLPRFDFDEACICYEDKDSKSRQLWRVVYDEAKAYSRFYDTSKLEAYVAELSELTGMPNPLYGEGEDGVTAASLQVLDASTSKKPGTATCIKQQDFNLYLHHKAVEDKWSKSFCMSSPRSFPEVLCAVLWGLLNFDYKYKYCRRCGGVFFYNSPHQTNCSRWYRGLKKTCATVSATEAKEDSKTLAAVNPAVQKLKKKAGEKLAPGQKRRASKNPRQKELDQAYSQWARKILELANDYAADSSIDAPLYHEWVAVVYPLDSVVDKVHATFPHYIIQNGKIVDRNTLESTLVGESDLSSFVEDAKMPEVGARGKDKKDRAATRS